MMHDARHAAASLDQHVQPSGCCGHAKEPSANALPRGPETKTLALFTSKLSALIAPYRPVVIITTVAVVGGLLAVVAQPAAASIETGMRMAMGLFLLPLALLKIFDVQGFAAVFRRYDPIAKAVPAYALVYPFIEAVLALFFIAGVWLVAAYAATALLFGIGAIGIAQSLGKQEKLACACVGNQLGVPLGVVSLAENIAMTVMSVGMLVL